MIGSLPPVVIRFLGDAKQFLEEQDRVMVATTATAKKIAEAAKAEAAAAEEAARAMAAAAADQRAAAQVAAHAYEAAALKVRLANDAVRASTTETWGASAMALMAAAGEAKAAESIMVSSAAEAGRAETAAADAAVVASGRRSAANEAAAASSAAFLGTATKTAAATSAILGGAALGVGIGAEVMAGKFEKSTTLLVTAGGESKDAIGMVSDGILQIARETGTSTEQLSQGMYLLEKAGKRGADGLHILRLAAQGARAEGVDLSVMTSALTDIILNYDVSADQAASITNQLVRAGGEAKTTMQQFATAMGTLVPIGAKSGLTFAELGGAIATVTQHGVSAQQGAENLAHAIQLLQNPNQVMTQQMAQMGLTAQDVAMNLGKKGLTGTLNELVQAIIDHAPEGKVLQSSFNESKSAGEDLRRMLASMPPALKDISEKFLNGSMSMIDYRQGFRKMGSESWSLGNNFLSLVGKAEGFNNQLKSGSPAAQTFIGAMAKMVGGQDALRTALMLTGVSGAKFIDNVAEISKAGEQNGQDIETWADTSSTLAVQWGQLAESANTLMVELGQSLMPVAKQVLGFFQDFMNWAQNNQGTFTALAAGIGTVAIALGAAGVAMMVASIAASPIALVVAGITLAVIALGAGLAWLVTHWDDVTKFITDIWNGFVARLKSDLDGFVNWWNTLWGGFGNFVKQVWDGFVSWIKGVLDGFMQWWHSWWDPFVAVATAAWDMFVTAAKLAVVIFGTVVIGPIVGMLNIIGAGIQWMIDNFWKPGWDAIVTAANVAWNWLNDNVFKPIGKVLEFVGLAFSIWWHGVEGIWNDFMNVLHAGWIWVEGNVFKPVQDGIAFVGKAFAIWWDGVQKLWQTFMDVLHAGWVWVDSNVFKPIRDGIDFVGLGFKIWWDGVQKLWKDFTDTLHAGWIWLESNVFKPISDTVGNVKKAFDEFGDGVGAAWNKVQDAAKAPVKFVVEKVYTEGIQKTWNSIADAVGLKDFRLPDAHLPFAEGGVVEAANGMVLPGYAPRRDSIRAILSPGEAVMVPEWTRAIGPKNVYAMNAAARNGHTDILKSLLGNHDHGGPHFADGGVASTGRGDVFSDIANGVGGFFGGVGSIINSIGSFLSDPVKAVTDLVKAPMEAMKSSVGGGNFGQMMFQLPVKVVGNIIDNVQKWIGSLFPMGAGGMGTPGAIGAGGLIAPLAHWVLTQGYSGLSGHNGIDMAAPSGTPIMSAADGRVSFAGWGAGGLGGNEMHIDHPNGLQTWYAHQSAFAVGAGAQVKQGQIVGYVGMTGAATGPHLHFMVLAGGWPNVLNPLNYIPYADGGVVGGPYVYDQGGMLPTGTSIVHNGTGQPERVLAPGQSSGVHIDHMHVHGVDAYDVVNQLEWEFRKWF